MMEVRIEKGVDPVELAMNELSFGKRGDLIRDIELCARLGFREMEISKGCLRSYLRAGGTLEELRGHLEGRGIRPVCLNSIESITFNGKRGERQLLELSEYLFYCAKAIGCPCVEVIASFKAPTEVWEEVREETVRVLTRLSDAARPFGIRLALEYMGVPASSVKTFAQGLEIVRGVGRDNVGLLVDTWHHYASGSTPEELTGAKAGEIFMVHTSDCPRGEALSIPRAESYLPGEGEAPLGEMLSALREIGYEGAVSVEVMAPALQELEPEELARLSAQHGKTLLEGF